MNLIPEKLTIYTDGSCINNGKKDAHCGSGIWISENHPNNQAIKIPGKRQSNQIAEIAAILIALQQTAPYIPITFVTDSKYAIEGLTKNLPEWENRGWIDVENSEYMKATAYHLRKRSAQTSFIWVKGHNGHHGNEQADRLANEGANKPNEDAIDLSVPDEFNLQGAALSLITQAKAYKGIRTKIKPKPRRQTTNNLDITRYALQTLTGHLEEDAAIWMGCRNTDLPCKIQQFLYKAIHGAYRIGEYWSNIPTYEHRAKCSHCLAEIETLEHIMLDCPNNACATIWNLTRDLWPAKHGEWPQMTIGTIMGCGNINKVPTNGQNEDNPAEHRNNNQKGSARLLRILMSESAHLIWTLRCDRTINGTQHSEQSITKRWSTIINKRLQTDRITAKMIIRKEKFKNLVTSTWSDVITTHTNHNRNWAIALEVLVGIKPPRPSTIEAPR
ncbi:ribonuclease H-like protein [Suillus hirtellus]|nr:ribonuclease H-like protein [Suillus hirtellus]